jgi:small subunit ribosomal protein S21
MPPRTAIMSAAIADMRGTLKPTENETDRGVDFLQVFVRDNNVDQALRVLKKKMQREGVFREMKRRRSYEKPSEKAAREKNEAIRRARKLARKKAVREGLIAAPRNKRPDVRKPGPPPRTQSA